MKEAVQREHFRRDAEKDKNIGSQDTLHRSTTCGLSFTVPTEYLAI